MELIYKITWLVFILSSVHQALSFYIDYQEFFKTGGGSLAPRSKKSIGNIHELLLEISKLDAFSKFSASITLALLGLIVFSFLGIFMPLVKIYMFIKKLGK